jgi:hypothetical protein
VLNVYVLLTIYLTPWSIVLLEKLIVRSASHEIPRSLLPCSQEPASDPCPEPDEINLLILCKEIIPVYSANHMKPISTKCGVIDC